MKIIIATVTRLLETTTDKVVAARGWNAEDCHPSDNN